jgi:predicted lipid-binding transport protein (Tim44 family)
MGEGLYFVEILVFAMVAVFLVLRLRSVLGRRNGEERQRPNPFAPPPVTPPVAVKDLPDNVIALPSRGRLAEREAPEMEGDGSVFAPQPDDDAPHSVAVGLERIHSADPQFDEKLFLSGARAAFEMIVLAYAANDTATLRPLLGDDVYDQFVAAIRARTEADETLETRLERIVDADISEARLEGGRTAVITVKFVSLQLNIIHDRHGNLLEGASGKADEVTDIWTFARNTRSDNPNWTLMETRVPY